MRGSTAEHRFLREPHHRVPADVVVEGGDEHIGVGGLGPDVCSSLIQPPAVELAERKAIERTGASTGCVTSSCAVPDLRDRAAVFADGSRRWAVACRRWHTASIRLVIVY
ncbi:hypothetical protein [Streptomyces angustmyceticus]|uniref:hypothetical protein n=1 Tax=Streptomyces angustmyceticus TaxID=285578 RepID=UPI003D8B2EAD